MSVTRAEPRPTTTGTTRTHRATQMATLHGWLTSVVLTGRIHNTVRGDITA